MMIEELRQMSINVSVASCLTSKEVHEIAVKSGAERIVEYPSRTDIDIVFIGDSEPDLILKMEQFGHLLMDAIREAILKKW